MPFELTRRGARLAIWGQLRFRPNLTTGDVALVQFRPRGAGAWVTEARLPARAPLGFFTGSTANRGPGGWRAVWVGRAAPYGAVSRTVSAP